MQRKKKTEVFAKYFSALLKKSRKLPKCPKTGIWENFVFYVVFLDFLRNGTL